MQFELSKNFASNRPVQEGDAYAMKRALNWLGYYTPYKKVGLIDLPDTHVFEALKRFQADHDLPASGEARPGDATVRALNAAVAERLKGRGS